MRRTSSAGSMSALTRQSTMRGIGGDAVTPMLGKKSQGAALGKKSLGAALARKSQYFAERKNTPYESARARMNWQNGVKLVRDHTCVHNVCRCMDLLNLCAVLSADSCTRRGPCLPISCLAGLYMIVSYTTPLQTTV